jgi:hypothetical protein
MAPFLSLIMCFMRYNRHGGVGSDGVILQINPDSESDTDGQRMIILTDHVAPALVRVGLETLPPQLGFTQESVNSLMPLLTRWPDFIGKDLPLKEVENFGPLKYSSKTLRSNLE